MFCGNCGKENLDQSKFCVKCGSSLYQPDDSNNTGNTQTLSVISKKLDEVKVIVNDRFKQVMLWIRKNKKQTLALLCAFAAIILVFVLVSSCNNCSNGCSCSSSNSSSDSIFSVKKQDNGLAGVWVSGDNGNSDENVYVITNDGKFLMDRHEYTYTTQDGGILNLTDDKESRMYFYSLSGDILEIWKDEYRNRSKTVYRVTDDLLLTKKDRKKLDGSWKYTFRYSNKYYTDSMRIDGNNVYFDENENDYRNNNDGHVAYYEIIMDCLATYIYDVNDNAYEIDCYYLYDKASDTLINAYTLHKGDKIERYNRISD